MFKQSRIICVSSLLAAFTIFAVRLSSAVPTSAQTGAMPRMFDSSVVAAPVASTPPFRGWLALGSGAYAQVPYQPELIIDPANGSFTIEGWLNNPDFSEFGGNSSVNKDHSFELSFDISGNSFPFPGSRNYRVTFLSCDSGFTCTGYPHTLSSCSFLGACAPTGWFHFAYVYNKATNKGTLFWNGQLLSDSAGEYIPNVSTSPIVLQYANSMDEFRISNNVRYTASFTPASLPFECDGNTQALWHFDEVTGTTTFHDACGTVDNMLVGYNGAHTEGVTDYRVYIPLVVR